MLSQKQKNFLYWLDYSMLKLNIKKKELAAHLGVSTATISRYLKMETFPKNTDKIVTYVSERSVSGGFHHLDSEDFSDVLKTLYKMFMNIVTQKNLAELIGVPQKLISDCLNQNPDTVRPIFNIDAQSKLIEYYRDLSLYYDCIDALRYIDSVEERSLILTDIDIIMSDCRFFSVNAQIFLEKLILSFWNALELLGDRQRLFIKFDKLSENINAINHMLLYQRTFSELDQKAIEDLTKKVDIISHKISAEQVYLNAIIDLGSLTEKAIPIIREIYDDKEIFQAMIKKLENLHETEIEQLEPPTEYDIELAKEIMEEEENECTDFSQFSRELGEIVLSNISAFCNENTIYLYNWQGNMELFRQLSEEKQDRLIEWLEEFPSIGCNVRKISQTIQAKDKFHEISTYRKLIYMAGDLQKKRISDKIKEKVTDEQINRFRLLAGNMLTFDAVGEIRYKLGFSSVEWYVWMLFVTADYNGANQDIVYEKIKSLSEGHE